MSLAPLIAAAPLIQIHALAAAVALVSGTGVILLPKGTPAHIGFGRVFVVLMLVVAGSSFWITTIHPGHYSWIHLLSVVTLTTIPLAIWRIRNGDRRGHALSMAMNWLGLLIAGAFTLAPHRILNAVFFGP